MEIGQILHNNPVNIPCESFHLALLSEIRSELSRVYWNVNQKPWAGRPHPDWDEKTEYRPLPPGIQWNPYYNWSGSPEDEDWDQKEAGKPNFSFEGVEFRWYKNFGRSLNVNVCWSADKWLRWYERCIQTITAYDEANRGSHGSRDRTPYPSPDGVVPIEGTPEDLRYLELLDKVYTLKAQITCIACVCIDVSENKKPRFDKLDWRWCHALDWVTLLGIHALKAPGKLRLHDNQE
jgi:hypothetical protein